MEKRIVRMIALNAEPAGYSKYAIESWKNKGYAYKQSNWHEIDRTETFENVSILIVRLAKKVDATILKKFPHLTHLVTATTGLDHIDEHELSGRGIKVISLRGHNDFLRTIPSTAEHTWALLMALIRNIPAANEDVKSGKWNRDNFRGHQVKGKTLGIVGFGRTGKKVAGFGEAFDMQIQYFDPYINDKSFHKCMELETLLSSSDIISLHIHLNQETEHLINRVRVSNFKNGSLLINTSRGKVMDENAVVEALVSRQLAGIAVDVLNGELEDIKSSAIWQAQQKGENVIITPHIGGATMEAMWACEEFIAGLI